MHPRIREHPRADSSKLLITEILWPVPSSRLIEQEIPCSGGPRKYRFEKKGRLRDTDQL